MAHRESYIFDHSYTTRYTFTSIGLREITKVVDFTYTGTRHIMVMGFGDLLPDGSVDDEANSNNGDIQKVLSTIIKILIDFMTRFPDVEVLFTGSTQKRIHLYARILRTHYSIFKKEFIINVLVMAGKDYIEQPFDPEVQVEIAAFFIKRIA